MSDEIVDPQEITDLEGRLTAAFDRIAASVAAVAIGGGDGGAAGTELADAQAEIARLRDELSAATKAASAVQAELAEARAEHETALAGLRNELDAAREAREGVSARIDELEGAADPVEIDRLREAHAAEIATLQAELRAARDAAEAPSEDDPGEAAALRRRVARLREERVALRAERDALADRLDEAENGPTAAEPARNALSELKAANADLRNITEEMRQAAANGENAPDPELLNAALAAEMLSLRAERAADAAELDRILQDIDGTGGGAGHA